MEWELSRSPRCGDGCRVAWPATCVDGDNGVEAHGLSEDHLAKFHKMTDAKEMWDAIKSRFGGNDKSKKMQKYILKQPFEGFSVSNSEGLHKGYDRSLPSALSQVSLIMRTKPGVDSLSFDDLYNNLRIFENDVKGPTASSSSTQNVAFVSENTSSTNERLITKVNQDNRRRDAWNSRNKDGRRSGKQEDSKALVTIDGYGVYDVEPVTQKKRR
ncbi:hypothetical protein Tco_0410552 [Tanacetum coccineum]